MITFEQFLLEWHPGPCERCGKDEKKKGYKYCERCTKEMKKEMHQKGYTEPKFKAGHRISQYDKEQDVWSDISDKSMTPKGFF
jgi:predicted amidophosphoribosyltransferase